jgi:hypothetical protein
MSGVDVVVRRSSPQRIIQEAAPLALTTDLYAFGEVKHRISPDGALSLKRGKL